MAGMMRRSFTAVIEQNGTFVGNFATEPYEAGWATEARWFVLAHELAAGTRLEMTPEISPDGLRWCAEGTPPLVVTEPGLHSLPLREFGNWLRLRVGLMGQDPRAKVQVHLALKE